MNLQLLAGLNMYSSILRRFVLQCLNALLLSSLNALVKWTDALALNRSFVNKYRTARDSHKALMQKYLGFEYMETAKYKNAPVTQALTSSILNPSKLGFHAAALVLRAGLVDQTNQAMYCTYLKVERAQFVSNLL